MGKVKIKASFFFFAAAAFFLSTEMGKNYLWTILFASLHEAGHLLAFVRFHCLPVSITLGAVGMRIDKPQACLSYSQECAAALCGPAVNLFFCTLFWFLQKLWSCFTIPFAVNTGLLVVNMLPVRMLDGGRFLYYFAVMKTSPAKAEKWLNAAELLVMFLLAAVLLFSLLTDYVNTSFVLFSVMLCVVTITGLLAPEKLANRSNDLL